VPSIAEAWISFERELSLIAVQGANGQRAFYPLAENVHREGILATTIAPYVDAPLQARAERWLGELMSTLDYRGVLAVEFFLTANELLANEMAPRVHNSGHWTIEGAVTSQFENHLRAILDLPLGATRPLGYSAMINLIGALPPRAALLAHEGVHFHDYGKQPRAGRKVGHCTVVEPTHLRRDRRARELLSELAPGIRIP